jgi:GNAT superfamily N-acetyltransferase
MTPRQSKIEVHPLTAARWDDLVSLFGERGAYSGCWCMYWRLPRSEFDALDGPANKKRLHRLAVKGPVPGLLAYLDGEPAGWCSIAPRDEYPALERSRVYKRLDNEPVWSIVCFFMRRTARGQGLMEQMIRGAVAYAKENGARVVEAYPTDLDAQKLAGRRLTGADGYMGIASVFRKAGFVEMRRASETKIIMRYEIYQGEQDD